MITMYFGNIGSGKTTIACRIAKKSKKPVYANFDTSLATRIEGSDLGKYAFSNSLLLLDESGIDFNNRDYKNFKKSVIDYVKLSRHYGCDIILFSQAYDDTEVTFRRLVEKLFYLKKVGPFTNVYRVSKYVMVDDNTHQIIDGYRKAKNFIFGLITGDITIVWRRLYYKYFDSYDKTRLTLPEYPEKGKLNTIMKKQTTDNELTQDAITCDRGEKNGIRTIISDKCRVLIRGIINRFDKKKMGKAM